MIGKVINYTNQQQVSFTSVTTNTCPQRLFSSVQTCGLVNFNQPLPWFSCIGQEKILSCFLEHFLCLCNILLQDLTPLHVKITRSTNSLIVCRKKLKLSTYSHIVSYNHISFLTRRWQLAWVLAMSSGFYSITSRTIAGSAGYKIHFRKQPPYRGNVFPCRCNIFRFLEFIRLGNSSTAPVFSYNQINKQPENLYVNYRGCSQRPRFYNVTLLHEKFLQFNWLRVVVFQLNLKYLHVKFQTFCG